MVYTPYWQSPTETDSRMCIRVAGDPAAALPAIRAAIAGVDPNVPVTETLPMLAQVRGAFQNVLLAKSVLVSAAGLSLLLTAIGLYGVLAFVVQRRTREIGIRMAIGARPREILRLFVTQGLRLAVLGVGAGLLLSMAAARLLKSFLYGVTERDPLSFLAGAAVLLLVALGATWLPSRRASRVDLIVALRHE